MAKLFFKNYFKKYIDNGFFLLYVSSIRQAFYNLTKKGEGAKSAGHKKEGNMIDQLKKNPKDTGSAPVQTALLTQKIIRLTKHFNTHKKDFHSMRGLMKMVSQRKKLLSYMKKTEPKIWQKTVESLSLRK